MLHKVPVTKTTWETHPRSSENYRGDPPIGSKFMRLVCCCLHSTC